MILFNDALPKAEAVAKKFISQIGSDIVLVRDLTGIISVMLNTQPESSGVDAFSAAFSQGLGKYAGTIWTKNVYDFLEPDVAGGKHVLFTEGKYTVYLIERRIVGDDWYGEVIPRSSKNPRACFFSIKGGVGRSTAAIHLAWHCAQKGEKVLLLDLDLESPGISTTIMGEHDLPDFGILDWFIEDGVGQGKQILQRMVGESRISEREEGAVLVAPAYGADKQNYLAKLSRCYSGTADNTGEVTWAERLADMIAQLEERERPDLIILDSRAGINDIAAAAATRLDCEVFLFAVNTPQTWDSYRRLFAAWQEHKNIVTLRERFKMVRSLAQSAEVPEAFLDDSSTLFAEFYDELKDGSTDGWSFDVSDPDAPHHPLSIYWHPMLAEFAPLKGAAPEIDSQVAKTAYSSFVNGVRERLHMENTHA